MRIRILTAVALMIGVLANAQAAVNQPVIDNKSCDAPKYPKASLMNEETGTVTLGFLIGTDGKVIESKIESSSGSKSLDKTALAALSLCKFKPGTKDGKVEQMWTKLDFVWKF